MKRATELCSDPAFRSAEDPELPGNILFISPYKAAVKYYAAQSKKLPAHIRSRVDVRTWDSSQGHEADIVFIDYVRGSATDFLDGMHRFNVGLTRARQGEFHIMQRRMVNDRNFFNTHYISRLYKSCSMGLDGERHGHVTTVDPE